jgi:hypothetical protein
MTVLVSALALAGCGGTAWQASAGSVAPSANPAARGAGPSGVRFEDPQGTYTMTVDRHWIEHSGGIVAEIEAWQVAAPSNGFAPNVNVLTQSAPGVDLATYIELSIKNGRRLVQGFRLVRSEEITGTTGAPLGVLGYTAQTGGRDLTFLAVVALRQGRAVVATLTAPTVSFADVRPRVEPFLLTLRAT